MTAFHVLTRLLLAAALCLPLARSFATPAARVVSARSAISTRAVRMDISPDDIDGMNDLVIIQADIEAKKTAGGLFLPTMADEIGDEIDDKFRAGTVVAAGPGRIREDGSLIPMPFKKGQRVLMPGSSSIGVQLDILTGTVGMFAYRQHELVGLH